MKKIFICSGFQLRILCAPGPVASVGLRSFFSIPACEPLRLNQVFVSRPEVRLQSSFSMRPVLDFLTRPVAGAPKTFHQHSIFVARYRFRGRQKFSSIPFIFPASIFSWPSRFPRRFCCRALGSWVCGRRRPSLL
jgi:hypothetical protein